MRLFGLVCLAAIIGLTLGGCGCMQQQAKGEAPPPKAAEPVVTPPAEKAEVPVVKETPPPPAAVVELKDINFDFDKYNIREKDAAILKDNTAWFKANPGKKAKIEGNCDERGTVEYNLVLGQKRADSAKAFLITLGIDGKLLDTVSYGKEKPVCPDHNEDCWAKNRRDHFVPAQ